MMDPTSSCGQLSLNHATTREWVAYDVAVRGGKSELGAGAAISEPYLQQVVEQGGRLADARSVTYRVKTVKKRRSKLSHKDRRVLDSTVQPGLVFEGAVTTHGTGIYRLPLLPVAPPPQVQLVDSDAATADGGGPWGVATALHDTSPSKRQNTSGTPRPRITAGGSGEVENWVRAGMVGGLKQLSVLPQPHAQPARPPQQPQLQQQQQQPAAEQQPSSSEQWAALTMEEEQEQQPELQPLRQPALGAEGGNMPRMLQAAEGAVAAAADAGGLPGVGREATGRTWCWQSGSHARPPRG